MEKRTIYLDNAATTPVDMDIMKKLHSVLSEGYGNASSQHQVGKKAKELLENARKRIAKEINALPEEIYFTSGGTESNNIAIQGLALANPNKKHIISSVIEHPSVIETLKEMNKKGYTIELAPVDKEGIVDVGFIKNKIRDDTLLVSVMHVNNEIGTIQPIEEISKLCSQKGVYFHTDAVQSVGKLDIDVKKYGISLLSASGHKLNAPKGIGFIFIKKGTKISPIVYGGGQERNIRSGTENVSGAMGFAYALDIKRDKSGIRKNRDELMKGLLKIPGSRINGSIKDRIYNNINISFYGIEGESLLILLDDEGICVSTGSACSSSKLEESHVLKAIGVDALYIHGSLRLTIDKMTEKEIKFVVSKIKEKVEKLREISPFKLSELSEDKNKK